VAMLTEHRKRGFDFFMITQHPMNMDIFIRRLIGSPGYHRHLKRPMGADLVSQLEWPAVNATCEKDGAGKSAETKLVPFPKEVYSWYRSAQLHTGKLRIPKMVWITLVCVLLVPLLGYFAAKVLMQPKNIAERVLGKGVAGASPVAPSGPRPASAAVANAPKVITAEDYVASRTPRIEGFAHSAPAYDAVTTPVHAPYPAACIDGFNRRTEKLTCDCYSQQGTKMLVPEGICKQIAQNGFFVEWDQKLPAQAFASKAVPPGDAAVPIPAAPVGRPPNPDVQRTSFPDRQAPDVAPKPKS